MSSNENKRPDQGKADKRAAKLAEALRQNLLRRKEQARARDADNLPRDQEPETEA